jgi:hypothetical protein
LPARHSSGLFAECPLQTATNSAAELGVHSLAFGGKFIVHNPSNVEKHDEELVSKLYDTPTYIQQLLYFVSGTLRACPGLEWDCFLTI